MYKNYDNVVLLFLKKCVELIIKYNIDVCLDQFIHYCIRMRGVCVWVHFPAHNDKTAVDLWGFSTCTGVWLVANVTFMLQSLNGIAVNGKKLKALEPCFLREGDTVQLGVPTAPDAPAQFVYRYFSSLKVRTEPKSKHKRPCGEDGNPAKRAKGSVKRDVGDTSGKPGHGAESERYAAALVSLTKDLQVSKVHI